LAVTRPVTHTASASSFRREPRKDYTPMQHHPFYHSYVRNAFAEENAFGARHSQPWAWAHFNSEHPDPAALAGPAPGNRVARHPGFAEASARLPAPYWENHDKEIAAYWRVWELAFDRKLRRATPENRFVSDFNATAFNDATFLWDSAFITLFGRYGRRAWNFQATLDNFYAKQHPDGFICREIRERDGEDKFQRFDPAGTGPNVFAWAEWEYFRHTGDRARLARVFAPIAAYTRWFRQNRTWPDGSYWGTGWSTGMDNQPRIPHGRHEWYEHCHQTWVDTCMQAVLADRMLVVIAGEIGREADAAEFAEEAERLTEWINRQLWDERGGFYHDRRRDGSLITEVKSIGAYWALLAGVVPAGRLERFLAHLEDPAVFCRAHRCPSLSADTPGYDPDGGYWRGAVWPPTNYMLLRGLQALGRDNLAHQIGLNHVRNVADAQATTGTLWENYAPDFAGAGRSTPDFVGWTGLPPVAVLFEQVFGLEPLGPARLRWTPRLTEAHGVERYPIGTEATVDLRCAARASASEEPMVSLTVDSPFELEVIWPGGTKRVVV
jgi:hypothetical protein